MVQNNCIISKIDINLVEFNCSNRVMRVKPSMNHRKMQIEKNSKKIRFFNSHLGIMGLWEKLLRKH